MASNPDPLAELLAALQDRELPEWSGPGDLGRISVETFAARNEVGRQLVSHGALRLRDDSSGEYAVRLDNVAGVAARFQRLVSAVGGSFENQRSLKGRLSTSVLARTRLRINASPAPGSVVFRIEPEQDPYVDTLSKAGDIPLDAQLVTPLADQSMAAVIEVLSKGLANDPSPQSSFITDLGALGPRAASAVRALAAELSTNHVELGVVWQEPRQPTRRLQMSAQQAAAIGELVAANQLDLDDETLVGVLHTVSDRRALELETRDQGWLRINLGDEPPTNLGALQVGQDVEVVARVSAVESIGGDPVRTYTLVSVRVL